MKQTRAEKFAAIADKLEARSLDPRDKDAPGWLRKIAGKCRRRATKKERAIEHKQRQKKRDVMR
jgi:hypothetical protein